MLNVGEFSRSWLSGTPLQLRKRKKHSSSCVYVLHKTPHKDVVVQWRQRNASKSALHVQNYCFAYLRPSPYKSRCFLILSFYTYIHSLLSQPTLHMFSWIRVIVLEKWTAWHVTLWKWTWLLWSSCLVISCNDGMYVRIKEIWRL